MAVTDKEIKDNTVTFTADFYDNYERQGTPVQTKTYAIEFYDGGYYFLSAVIACKEAPAKPGLLCKVMDLTCRTKCYPMGMRKGNL